MMWEEFERNIAVQLGVMGFVDDTHSTFTELLDDAVMRYGLPDHWFLLLAGIGTLER
jgi:hypothetical protein